MKKYQIIGSVISIVGIILSAILFMLMEPMEKRVWIKILGVTSFSMTAVGAIMLVSFFIEKLEEFLDKLSKKFPFLK